SYRRVNVISNDMGNFFVVISNSFGTVQSSNAALAINFPPGILTQPQGGTFFAGTNVTLSASVNGTPPFNYQWRHDGLDIDGGYEGELLLEDVQSSETGQYSVRVSNVAGSVVSSNALLIVKGPPSILEQPTDAAIPRGSNATFSVTAVGQGGLHYQWHFNDANLLGATNSSFIVTNVQPALLGFYSVTITNPYGATLSEEATLSFDSFVVFSENFETNLLNWTNATGDNMMTRSALQTHAGTNSALCGNSLEKIFHQLPIEVEGHRKATFWIYDDGGTQTRWFGEMRSYTNSYGSGLEQILAAGRFDPNFGTNQTGEFEFESSDPTYYQARVLNGFDSGYCNLYEQGLVTRSNGWHRFEIEQMEDETTVNFSVDGSLERTVYDVTPATWDSVSIGSVGRGNVSGNVWFDDIKVEYLDPPLILADPMDTGANPGGNATFFVEATGNVQSYQWRFNGTNLAGATASSLTLTNVSAGNIGFYSAVVLNGVGPAKTVDAELFLNVPPQITLQPQSQSVVAGTDVTFSAEANGTEPHSYQWRFKGSNIPGATDLFYTRTNVQPVDAGAYSVAVTNAAGGIVSSNAMLIVRVPQAAQFGSASVVGTQLTLMLTGGSGSTYEIQSSTNLANWFVATNVTFNGGTYQFTDTVTNRQRFYRTKLLSP
ncbi:MAG: hypothetical protein JWM68_5076, partial [Verrucomicrobiales bacterium]|nr:hypothetical protein [Verrucomicrobiales bacterium]